MFILQKRALTYNCKPRSCNLNKVTLFGYTVCMNELMHKDTLVFITEVVIGEGNSFLLYGMFSAAGVFPNL